MSAGPTLRLGARWDGAAYTDDAFAVPLSIATQSLAVLAIKGAGKSNVGVVLGERFYEAGVPWVAIDPKGDWHGIRTSGDGKKPGLPIPVFGGLHGDRPLTPGSGALMAELICKHNLTCVLDVSEFDTKSEMLQFLLDFGRRLFKLHGRSRQVRHLFLEECDEFMPQKVLEGKVVANACLGMYQKIVKQGRHRGLGSSMISQRSAVVNKDALTQIETMIAMRVTAQLDRNAIRGWVDYNGVAKELVDSLPLFDSGEAWVISPSALKTIERVRFDRRWTLDTGSTPELGVAPVPVGTIADVDLSVLDEQIADMVTEAEATDPARLTRRIRELERKVTDLDRALAAAQKRATASPLPPAVEVEVEVLIEHVPQVVSEALAAIAEHSRETAVSAAAAVTKSRDLEKLITRINTKPTRTRAPDRPGRTAARLPSPPRPPTRAATPPPPPAPPGADADVKLKAGARRMIETLARQHPMRLTRRQLGLLANVKASGGTFGDYLSVMRVNGLVSLDGDFVDITEAGFAAAGMVPSDPLTTDAIIAMYQSKLKAGARRMLDVVVEAWPDMISREDLGARAGVEPSGGTFGDYLSVMCTNGLAEKVDEDGRPHPKGNYVRAGEALHLDQ